MSCFFSFNKKCKQKYTITKPDSCLRNISELFLYLLNLFFFLDYIDSAGCIVIFQSRIISLDYFSQTLFCFTLQVNIDFFSHWIFHYELLTNLDILIHRLDIQNFKLLKEIIYIYIYIYDDVINSKHLYYKALDCRVLVKVCNLDRGKFIHKS